MSTSPLVFDPLVIPEISGRRVLDLGCGYGKWGFLVKKYFWHTRDGSMTAEPFVCGVDLFYDHLPRVRRHRIYDGLVNGDAARLPFRDKAFDTTIATEVLEHLEKADGERFLAEVERVSGRCVILSTPNHEDLRDGLEGLDGFNPYEAHRSYWTRAELRARGYRCRGVGVRLPFRSRMVGKLLEPFASRFPIVGEHLIAIKRL